MQRITHWLYLPILSFFFAGCVAYQPIIYRPLPHLEHRPEPKNFTHKKITPEKPTQVYKLKEVQDNNFNPDYMYPSTPYKQRRSHPKAVQHDTVVLKSITKDECISMIGEARYDRYTKMLGSEAAAIKRCEMLKSMQ